MDNEIVEGADCYHVRGLDWDGNIIDVWIGMKDLLIRRISSQLMFSEFTAIKYENRRNVKSNQCHQSKIRSTIDLPPKQGLKTIAGLVLP
jgi:hypothetical protein